MISTGEYIKPAMSTGEYLRASYDIYMRIFNNKNMKKKRNLLNILGT